MRRVGVALVLAMLGGAAAARGPGYARCGYSAERRRLIARWEKEIQNQGR